MESAPSEDVVISLPRPPSRSPTPKSPTFNSDSRVNENEREKRPIGQSSVAPLSIATNPFDKSVFYPLQKAPYIAPSYALSSESKRVLRQAQSPVWSTSPNAVHFLYEV